MLKAYFIDLFNRFKNKSLFTKCFFILLFIANVFLLCICLIRTKYNVIAPGELNRAEETVTINTKNNEGNILTVAVSEFYNVPVIQYWLAKNNEKFAIEDSTENVLSNDEYQVYSILSKRSSINEAIIIAYEAARLVDNTIHLQYNFEGMRIFSLKNTVKDLELNDLITKVEGKSFNDINEFHAILDELLGEDRLGGTKNIGDSVQFTVIRNDVELERSAMIFEEDGKLKLGITIKSSYYLDSNASNPSFKINYNEKYDASGSSGGAMMALSIYNQLLAEDVTKGLFIAGTGTINIDGSIGAIGAIEQKTIEVFTKGLDLFFVDGEEYYENGLSDYDYAVATAKKFGYDDSKIIKVKTFDDIISYLNSYGD